MTSPRQEACRERGHHRLAEVRRQLRMDIRRILTKSPEDIAGGDGPLRQVSAFFTPGLLSVFVYRVSHFLWVRGWRRTARLASGLNAVAFKAMIDPESCVAGGWFLPHPAGVSFRGSAGRRLTVYSLSSCGPLKLSDATDESPRLGDEVVVAVHAAVRGVVSIGDRAKIGFRAAVDDDVGADHVAVARNRRVDSPRSDPVPTGSTLPTDPVPQRWREVRSRLREDRRRLRSVSGDSRASRLGYLAVWLHRLSHYRYSNGGKFSARLFWQLNLHLTGADIDPATQAAGGLVIPHPAGITLHAVAGRDLTLLAMASVGPEPSGPRPRLADHVMLEPQALVYGPVSIGEHARLTSGCVVTSDVAARTVVVAPATLRIRAATTPTG